MPFRVQCDKKVRAPEAPTSHDAAALHAKQDGATIVPRLLRAGVTTKPQPLSVLRASEAGGSSGDVIGLMWEMLHQVLPGENKR